jgi:tetratricopeptide (TPR) repeat protein
MAKGSQRHRSRAAARHAHAPSGRRAPSVGRVALACACAVELAAALVYLNAFGSEFVLDDIRLIRDNLRIRELGNLAGFFWSPYWDIEGAHALYRPLVLATYAVNYAIGGLSTYGYTAVNITLHVAVSLLLFLLIRTIGGSLFVATVGGLLFAVHPVHTEAVTGISGRPELLAALFFLTAMHAHWRAPDAGAGINRYRIATLACFAGALLAKESAMTLLLVLPAMDALLGARASEAPVARLRSRAVADYLPLAVVAVAYLAARRAVLGSVLIAGDAIAPLDNPLVPVTTTAVGERLGATTWQALMTAFAVVTEYARLLLWPLRLSPDYSLNQIPLATSAVDVRFLAGVLIVAACIAGVAALRRRHPLAAFGLAFLALTFSIVSNFAVTIGTICAERLMYLPSAGLIVAAAAGIEALARTEPRRRAAVAVLGILIVMAAARTWTRNRDWKTELSLWSAAIEVAPASARVQSEYGRVQAALGENAAQAGRTAEAEQFYQTAQTHYEKALEIYPSYALAMDGLANILSLHQRFDEALVLYEKAVRAWPGNYASLTNWAGLLWDRSNRASSRVAELRAEGKSADAEALERQAAADAREALEKVDRVLVARPSYAHAHLIRALLLDASDPPAAIREFEEVLRLMPSHPQRPIIEKELLRLKGLQAPGAAPR